MKILHLIEKIQELKRGGKVMESATEVPLLMAQNQSLTLHPQMNLNDRTGDKTLSALINCQYPGVVRGGTVVYHSLIPTFL